MAVPAVAKRLEGDGGRTQAVGPGLTVIPEGKGGGVQHRLQAPAWAYAVIPGHICSENGVLPPKTPLKPPPPPPRRSKGGQGGGASQTPARRPFSPRHPHGSNDMQRNSKRLVCCRERSRSAHTKTSTPPCTQRLTSVANNTFRRACKCVFREPPPPPCVTFRRVVAPLRGPGRSPVLPFACCVGLLLSVGRCGRCSCWCRFRVRGAQWLVCWGCGMVCRWRVSGAQ